MSYSPVKSKMEQLYLRATKILEIILKYQIKNNIEGMCITNTQYYRDCLVGMQNFNSDNIKIKPVMCIGNKYVNGEKAFVMVTSHLILKLDNKLIIDPSNDIASLEEKQYFNKIVEIKKYIKNLTTCGQEEKNYLINKINEDIRKFTLFIQHATKMNNGELLCSNREYYDNLADYVEEKMRKWNGYNNINKKITEKARQSLN